MPYHIVKRADKFVVEKKDGTKSFGTHDTEADAKKQLAALYASERHAEVRSLHLLGATGVPRTEMYDGRPHLVVPVVALMEGVIHAVNAETPEFVSADLLQRAAATWNGKPNVLFHPKRGDKQCSANDPAIITASGIGTIFNSRVEGKKLLCEAWIDKAKTEKLHPELYRDLQEGKAVEVSVGAFVVTDNVGGNFNGKPFKASWLEATGDHLAFLPGGRGACSVEMGCGAHRAAMHLVTAEGLETLGDTPGHDFHGNQWKEGGLAKHADNPTHKVKIVGPVAGSGKTGTLHTVMGSFAGVRDAKGKHLGYFHESNLKALGALPDKAEVFVEGGRMKVGDKVKINKPGHAAHGKTGLIRSTTPNGMVHTVGDHGTFHQSALRAAAMFDTPEEAASEEAAELIAYNAMRAMFDGVGDQWDEVSGLIDELIADEEENPTETAAQEAAEEEVEGARLDAIRMLCYAMTTSLQSIISACYEQTAEDLPQPTDPRYMAAFKACYGKAISAASMKTIQAAHDTSHTLHDNTTSLGAACNGMKLLAGVIQPTTAEDCTTCAGSGSKDGNPCPACDGAGHVMRAAAMTPQLKAACGCQGESTMDKKVKAELIAALVTDKHSGFKEGDEATLETFADARLESFKAAAEANKAAAEKALKDENDLRAAQAKLTVTEGKLKAAEQAPTEEQWLERAPAGIKTLLENQKAQDVERRDELVKLLKVAGANTEDELKAMPTAQLETLAKYAKVEQVDFSGRGLPQERAAASAEDDKQYDPPNPWAAGIKALQEQGNKASVN